MPNVRTISNMISAQACEDGIYLVRINYPESDSMNATGDVWRLSWDEASDNRFRCVLNTNDTLTALWASSENRLWVTSARGTMWTTANVKWTPPDWKPVEYEAPLPEMAWTATSLPKVGPKKVAPILNAIWGVDDRCVFAGAYSGDLFRWDGTMWSDVKAGGRAGINHIHGSGRNDVWAVGEEGTILHFDGRSWATIPFPGNEKPVETLTGVRAIGPNEAVICGRSGSILRGSADGLELVAHTRAPLYGIAHFRERILLAGGDKGALELVKNKVTPLRDTFAAVGIFECREQLLFVQPNQEAKGPGVIIHNPDGGRPWYGCFLAP